MIRTPFPANDSGFTIIEVLMALAIFSIGLMALGALQARALMDTGDIARKTEAWTIAGSHADWLKTLPFYANPATQTFDPNLVAGAYNQPAPPPNNNRYSVHWQVTDDIALLPYNNTATPVFSGVGNGTYTVAKAITVVVTRLGGNAATDALAQVQFLKTWAATGIP